MLIWMFWGLWIRYLSYNARLIVRSFRTASFERHTSVTNVGGLTPFVIHALVTGFLQEVERRAILIFRISFKNLVLPDLTRRRTRSKHFY